MKTGNLAKVMPALIINNASSTFYPLIARISERVGETPNPSLNRQNKHVGGGRG